MSGHKLLYIFDHTDWKSRMPIAIAAKDAGWHITIGLVGAEPEDKDVLQGFDTITLPRPKNKLGPIATLKTILAIRKLITALQPELVHTVTLKYAFLVGLACTLKSGFKRIYTIAGLGFLFRGEGTKPYLLRLALSRLLIYVLRNPCARLIFQNPDDRDLLTQKKYVAAENTYLVISSGVDLKKFTPVPEIETDPPLVLMPTRMVHEKGIHVFVEAARLLKARGINASFQIAGGETRHNPKAISREEMLAMTQDGAAEWLGHVDNLPALLQKSAVIVYPSYYGEGVPRVLIEACAAGRPIITTDHPGCRETVKHGENGLLIPIKNVQATADAIEKLLSNKHTRQSMGLKSRALAEEKFDITRVVEETLKVYSPPSREGIENLNNV